MTFPRTAALDPSEVANQVIGSEGVTKAVMDTLFLLTKSKPAMIDPTSILFLASIPIASSGMFIAYDILIGKTFG